MGAEKEPLKAPPREPVSQWLGEAELTGISYQSSPDTPRPFKLRGAIRTGRSVRGFAICLSYTEAEKIIDDLRSFMGERSLARPAKEATS